MMEPFLDYDLPERLIAQAPASERDAARLMAIRRASNDIAHHIFRDLPDLLQSGDLIVLNDSRVIPARLTGNREATGGKWEGLFLRETADGLWELLAQTKGKPAEGEVFTAGQGRFRLTLREKAQGRWFMQPLEAGRAFDLLGRHGEIPLPPYIMGGKAAEPDRDRYQTVYARIDGSVAAPTAGLHFTPELFKRLADRQIERAAVTLHVGLGTFQPIRTTPDEHRMQYEWADVPPETVEAINACKRRGGQVIAIGTTATRALESAARDGHLVPWTGQTNLFIRPPYSFQVIDGLVTNFHLPKTTLLLLVGALTGSDLLARAYAAAIAQEYRFYSYGDAMLIL